MPFDTAILPSGQIFRAEIIAIKLAKNVSKNFRVIDIRSR